MKTRKLYPAIEAKERMRELADMEREYHVQANKLKAALDLLREARDDDDFAAGHGYGALTVDWHRKVAELLGETDETK